MRSCHFFSFLSFDKRKGYLGAGIALAALLAWGSLGSWKAGALFAAAFLVVGPVRIHVSQPALRFLLSGLWGIGCILFSCAVPTTMVSSSSFFHVGHYRVVMNFVCVAAFYGMCLMITGEIKSAVAAASAALLVMATANAFLFQFRGNELKPMDFLSVRTALNVAGQYTFRIQPRMLCGWLVWLWMMACLHALPPSDPGVPKWMIRLAAVLASCACVMVVWRGSADIHTNTWSNGGSTENGYFLNFCTGFRDCFMGKPEGYSPEAVEDLAARYDDASEASQEELPNILVIMNESFADFSVLGDGLRTNQPVLPFVSALQENTIRGNALVSIFGGVTANSEFEFLTGGSMANLPEGSVPYQQYIYQDIYSLPRLLNAYGYRSMATHPYIAEGWNRPAVYPHLGFSESTFAEDYPWENLIREFVSDQEMYEHVLEVLREPAEKPLFLFGITMQNHGDYIYTGDHYTQTIFLEGYENDYPMAEQYLTLVHESDKAAAYLLTELEKLPEKTVVLFFGDHFPQVEGDFFQEVHGGEFETLSEKMLQYQVPFFLWANFDIPEQTVECTSLNYLSRYLLETAGLELTPYYRFLKELEEGIPAVNALGYYSVSQQTFLPLEEAEGEEAELLSQYAMVQYNNLFDGSNRSPLFFQRYMQ